MKLIRNYIEDMLDRGGVTAVLGEESCFSTTKEVLIKYGKGIGNGP